MRIETQMRGPAMTTPHRSEHFVHIIEALQPGLRACSPILHLACLKSGILSFMKEFALIHLACRLQCKPVLVVAYSLQKRTIHLDGQYESCSTLVLGVNPDGAKFVGVLLRTNS